MSLKKLIRVLVILLCFYAGEKKRIVAVGNCRIFLPCHPAFSYAIALFGGAYFTKNTKAYFFPLITLWLGDIVLNKLVFYHE